MARVDLVGGAAPEYCAFLDPLRMASLGLDFAGVADALAKNNVVVPAGVHQENHSLYLTVVDGRMHSAEELGNLLVPAPGGAAIPLKDFARVERSAEPALNVVTANGMDAVLLNIYSQPDGSTLDIADHLHAAAGPDAGLAAAGNETVALLRSVPAGPRFRSQRVGGDCFRADSVGGDSLSVPLGRWHDFRRDGGHSDHRADHDPGHETVRPELQPDDAGGNRGGDRAGDRRCDRRGRGDSREDGRGTCRGCR